MNNRRVTDRDILRIERQKRIGIWLSENCSKPANTVNSVSFGELMRQLGAEAESKNTNGVSFTELMRQLRNE